MSGRFDFDNLMFSQTDCDELGLGHDVENAFLGYDFKGTLVRFCPRPWCGQPFEYVQLDDLEKDEWDNLMEIIRNMSSYEPE